MYTICIHQIEHVYIKAPEGQTAVQEKATCAYTVRPCKMKECHLALGLLGARLLVAHLLGAHSHPLLLWFRTESVCECV